MSDFARNSAWVRSTIGLALALGLAPAAAIASTIELNFTGVTLYDGMGLNKSPGYAPPDNGGGVGPNDVVQLVNGAFAVYNKTTGAQTQLISARQFWINAGVGDPGSDLFNIGTFNARILYDPTSSRWIAAGLTGQSVNNDVMIARSETSDPSGAWQAVRFLGNNGGTGKFADYTALGVDADGVYVTTNNYTTNSSTAPFTHVAAYSLPKTSLMASTPTTTGMSRFYTSFIGRTVQPVIDFYGPSNGQEPMLARSDAFFGDTELFRTTISGTTAAGATLSAVTPITVAGYADPQRASQPDLTRSISTVDARISSNVYQLGNIMYTVQTTAVSDNVAGLFWTKIDASSNAVIQQGYLTDPNYDYFNASIAANPNGDVVIGFTRSGILADGNLSAYAVIGHTSGGNTTFGTPFLLKEGLASNYHYGNGRWGDFSTTVLDPSNPNVFWTFQEYALASDAWATLITEIAVPEPSGIALAAAALSALAVAAWRRKRKDSTQSGLPDHGA